MTHMTHTNPITAATQDLWKDLWILNPLNFVFSGLFSPAFRDRWNIYEAIKEAKFIGNSVINVIVVTAKYKS